PSSNKTSITLPVTLDETVAARRAVTYPEAFSTVCCTSGPPASRASTVRTSSVLGRVKNKTALATINPRNNNNTHQILDREARFGLRSMRRSSSVGFDELIRFPHNKPLFSDSVKCIGVVH